MSQYAMIFRALPVTPHGVYARSIKEAFEVTIANGRAGDGRKLSTIPNAELRGNLQLETVCGLRITY